MIFKKILFALCIVCALIGAVSCAEKSDVDDFNAYIIKIDGKEIGYVQSKDDVTKLRESLGAEKLSELDSKDTEIIKVSVNNKIESTPVSVKDENLLSPEDVAKKYLENGGKISFSVTVSEKEIKYVSFETVYKNSPSHYEGTKVVQSKGQQGERTLTYEVTYTDGVESERVLISDVQTKKSVDEVVLIGTKKSTASTGKYAWPLKSVTVTSSYGNRYLNGSYNFHLGVDLRAPNGTAVYAADGGKVTHAGWLSSYGYLIKILHDNGDYTYYAHLSKINVSVGSRVYKGQAIALSGSTGNVTGPHLHFEIRKNGSTVNPVSYLPSLNSVRFAYSESLDTCRLHTAAYQSRFVQPAFLSSKREQEVFL